MDTTLILRISEKGFYVNIPGVSPTRTPADIDITKINLNLVLSFLRSSGIKDFTILSKSELGEKVIKPKDIMFKKKEKDEPKENVKEVEKRLDRLENMIGRLLTKKDEGISKDQIKNKLDFLEVLIKNINISEQNIQFKSEVKREPEIEELDTFIPDIDISGLSMKGESSQEILNGSGDIDESANLLSKLLNQGKRGGKK
jgi:hypothetical protein